VLDTAARGPERNLYYQHRRLQDGDLFFLSSHSANVETYRVWFAAAGEAQVWDPDSGQRYRLGPGQLEHGGQTLSLHFEPYQTYAVVWAAQADSALPLWPQPPQPAGALDGDWKIEFISNQDNHYLAAYDGEYDLRERVIGPTSALCAWWHLNMGHFSGSARYRCVFQSDGVPAGQRVWLDLGRVEQIAEVALNGQALGARAWWPFRVEVTEALAAGENVLEVIVTNGLANALMHPHGDQPAVMGWVPWHQLTSGLLGPVQFMSITMT
jgi:hypothetical protein